MRQNGREIGERERHEAEWKRYTRKIERALRQNGRDRKKRYK